ncbi:MAG: TIGR03943 family protein [Anaerolineae bacterium]|nr:TIGR03943 family protein [Anaerolineae bacterium]MDW8172786.1 TIGR03943 family protein [Anaerolineae bacterium]
MNTPTNWREWIKAGILLGLALYLALLMLGGKLDNYINVRFQWLTIVAILILSGLGLWSAWQLFKADNLARQHDVGDYQHARVSGWSLSLLIVPLAFGVLFPSRPLDVNAVQSVSLAAIGGGRASASIAPQDRNILDWLREINRVDNPASFNGQPVDLIGFIYREPDMPADQFMVARFTVSCCVADAFAIGLPVQLEGAEQYATGAWVRLRGALQVGQFRGQTMPIIRPQQVEEIPQPDSPYLYG